MSNEFINTLQKNIPNNGIFQKIFTITCYFILTWFLFVGLLGLLISVETLQTLIFCITFLYLLFIPIIYILFGKLHKNHFFIFLTLFVIIFSFGFKENYKKDGNYELVCLDNCVKYNWNLLNIIQEKEFLNTGFRLAFLLGITNDQLFGFENRVKFYEEKVKIDLPSHIPRALLNINNPQQYIIYTPQNLKNIQKAIFVIHGNAGGFQFYQKFFKQFADSQNLVVVEPIFGWGNWDEKGGVELIYKTYEDLLIKSILSKDTKITLLGLSNGGKGLSRTVYFDNRNIFSNIVYVSGVIEPQIIKSPSFQKNSTNKNFYVIHGKKDDRTFYSNFLEAKDYFKNLESLVFENGDHFLLLNKEDEVKKEIYKIIGK